MSAATYEAAIERNVRSSAASTPGEVLSPSQVSTYLACSARHWFRYGLGLPDPSGGGAVRGKAVHAMAAYWMAAKMEGITLEPAGMPDAFEHAWDAAAEGAEFAATDDIDQLKASGLAMTQKYLAEAAPAIEPAAVEVPVTGTIAGVPVRGIVDIVDVSGRVIDIKTKSRKASEVSPDHAFQLATYTQLMPGASGEARIDLLVSTKEPQLVQIDHTPSAAGRQLVERLYPLVAEGIAGGLYVPNRSSSLCSRRYCAFWKECQAEFGGEVAA
jgi:CRISPR/Cas system-associated exonuclease Cas4 (RecB family)